MDIVQLATTLTNILIIIWQILKTWWWFILPVIFYFLARYLYAYWVRWFFWYRQFKWVVLEIKTPKEILKPFKAMEDVFSGLWGIIDVPNWRERWCEGELPIGGGHWFSFEVASFGGDIHFYLRVPEGVDNVAKNIIYAQYPEVEFSIVNDYTKNVPSNIPNEKFDLYGEDFTFFKKNVYPLKTYPEFFEPMGERISKEEKRIDPINAILESLSKLNPGEQIWIQIVAIPITNELVPWIDEGNKIIEKIAKRTKPKSKPLIERVAKGIGDIAEEIATGVTKPERLEEVREKAISPAVSETGEREMLITPGERRILTAIENKMSKPAYLTFLRTLHIFKTDEPHLPKYDKILASYLTHFASVDMNALHHLASTRTRIHYFFRKSRNYARARNSFRYYKERLPYFWPASMEGKPLWKLGRGKKKATVILNTEELVSIFHFPSKIELPTVPRVEAKKSGPPPTLPIE